MKFLFLGLLFIAYSQARLTIPIEKVFIDRPVSDANADAVSGSPGLFAASSDSMKVTLQNLRNFFYFGNIYVGSNNQIMKVLFDTGSNDLWLSTPTCYACPGKNRFSCAESNTCSKSSDRKELGYGLGQVSGYIGKDMIGLTPTFKTKSPILMVDSGYDLSNYDLVDGFIGLGSRNNAEDFIDLAFKDGAIDEKIFAFYMDYNGDATRQRLTNGTYMTIGYVPEDKINNMAWIPVTDSNRWAADILGIKVGDTILSKSATTGTVLFDTGCSLNHFTSDIRTPFMAQMKAMPHQSYAGIDWWPCYRDDLPTYPNISLSVKGLRIDVTAFSYFDFPSLQKFNGYPYCQIIMSDSLFGMNILGDAFLQDNFIAYSKRNQTIGVHMNGKHEILPDPNPPALIILIQVALMLLIGAALFLQDKKRRLTKTALSDEDTMTSQQNITHHIY